MSSSIWKFIKKSLKPKSKKEDNEKDSDNNNNNNNNDDDDDDDSSRRSNSNHNIKKEEINEKQNNNKSIDDLLKQVDNNKLELFAYKLYDNIINLLQNDENGLIICFDNLAEFILTLLNSIENKIHDENQSYQTIILILCNELLIQTTNSYFDNNNNNNNNNISLKSLYEFIKWYGWWYNTISKLQILKVEEKCFEILKSILNKNINANSISNIISDYIGCISDRYLYSDNSEQNIGASYNLGELCFTLLKNFTCNPNEYLMQHSDGTLYTTVTIALWELFHINIDLAKDSKVPLLTLKTITSIITIQTFILEKILMFLSHEKRKKLILSINIITNSKAILNSSNGFMFDLMIALTNDCAIQMNELVTIVSDNQNNEISELLSQVGITLTGVGDRILKEITDVIIHNFNGNKLCYKMKDVMLVINSLHSHLPFLFHKLLPFWNEKLIVCMYEKFMNVFVSSIIYVNYFNRVEILNTLAAIQKEFMTYDPACVSNSIYNTESMNWLLNLLQSICSEDKIYFSKCRSLCSFDDEAYIEEILIDFCSIRSLSVPSTSKSNSNDLQHSRIFRNVISSQQYLNYHHKESEIQSSLEFNKVELFTLLGQLKFHNNKSNENDNDSNRNEQNNIKKNQKFQKRRWSRIKPAKI